MEEGRVVEEVIAIEESSVSEDSSSLIEDTDVSNRVNEDYPSALHDHWDDPQSEMTSQASSMFPREEYVVIVEVLHQLHGAFPIQHLVSCLKASVSIQRYKRHGQDATLVRRFLRENVQACFERCLRQEILQRLGRHQLDYLLEAIMQLITLCAVQLQRLSTEAVHGFGSPEVQEAEQDLVPVLMCLGNVMEGHAHTLFSWIRDADLPKSCIALLNAGSGSGEDVDGSVACDEALVRPFELEQATEHKWWRCCYRHFMLQGCFANMKQVLDVPDRYSVLVLDWSMHLFKLVAIQLPPECLQDMPQLMKGIMDHLMVLIERDEERLSNFGRDRNYMHFSSVLQNATSILCRASGVQQGDFKEVAQVQRKFVESMLQSSNFNKLLSAVRECNNMLKRSQKARDSDSGSSLQANNEWLVCENVVKLMLRANLHQRQYAEQVLGILTLLTEEHYLKEEHLEMLWSLTEQEDTFETVKNNVYMILAEIASALEPLQLDLLFRKFQVNKGRSVPDTMRILDLLKRLAISDSEAGSMADKLLGMMWDLTMHADAHPELLRSNAIQDVLRGYDDRGHTYLVTYVRRCLDQLRARHNVCSSLNLFRTLLALCPMNKVDTDKLDTLGDLVDRLIKEERVLELLVGNLKAVMRQAHLLKREHPKAEPLGEGFYSYQQILQEHLLTIEFLAKHSEDDPSMPEELVVQLWNAFLREPPTERDLILGVNWFKNALDNQFLTPDTLETLLQRHAVQTPLEHVDIDWFRLFEMLFLEVNLHRHKLGAHCLGDMMDEEDNLAHYLTEDLVQDPGLSYLWRVAMECGNEEVAGAAQLLLAGLYHANTPPVEYTPQIHAALLKRCVDLIFGSCKALLGSGREAEVDWSSVQSLQIKDQQPGTIMHLRILNRALSLLLTFMTAVQGRTMPPVPAHRASFAGTPCVLDCQFFANSHRFKVLTHSNEYIGYVRKKAAAEIQSQPQRVRLTSAGQEWNNDSQLVSGLELKTRQVVNVSTCQINNTYTKTWDPDYVDAWHANAPVWLLSKMEHIYDVMFLLADLPGSLHVRSAANDVLNQLPTSPAIPALLREALSSSNPCEQLQKLLMSGTGGPIVQPAKLLYTLQALHGVLFPIHEEATPLQQDVSMRDKDGLPSSNALMFDTFLSAGCLLLVSKTVQKACSQSSTDPAYLHNISRLMVLMMGRIVKETASSTPAHEAQSDSESAQRQSKVDSVHTGEDPAPTPQPSPASHVCVLASALNIAESEQVAKSALDQERAALMVSFLVDLARQAGCMWGLPVTNVGLVESAVSIVRDALNVLLAVLEQHPDSCGVFLKDDNARRMAADLLLNTMSPTIRISARDTLARICIDNHSEGHEWLLRLLISERAHAAQLGKHSSELFALFHQTVATIPLSGTTAEFGIADELLQDEVQQLHKVPKVEDDNSSLVLEWRLKLVNNLVTMLDKHSVGTSSEGGLVRLLLTEYLFPEAYLQSQYPTGVVPGERLQEVMTPCPCHTPSCRRVALELVADLMVHSLVTLKEGAELLHTLHYCAVHDDEVKWDQQPPTLMRSTDGYVGLKNAGATCYMNSTLQQLFMQPRIRGLVLSAAPVHEREQEDSIFHNLQLVFANLTLSLHGFYSPKGFWLAFKDYDGQPIDTREHQDVYEFFTRLQDQVDHHLKSTNQKPALQAATGGKFVQQIICRDVDYRSERMEDFYQISVEVRGKHNLEQSLESYVQGELMEGDNAYFCEEIGRKVTAVKRSCIKELPNTLVIHLKRFEFDHHTQSRYKVRDRFEFPLHLDMFKYTAEGLAAAEGHAVSPSRPASYYKYELKGVIVHSGSAFTGHYYSYIKERNKRGPNGKMIEGRWFCFDDKLVKPWDVSTLEQDCYGGLLSQDIAAAVRLKHGQDMERPHSAYMLFYDRAEQGSVDAADCLQNAATGHLAGCSSGDYQHTLAEPFQSESTHMMHARGGTESHSHTYSTPCNLPQSIYESVMRDNIYYLHRLHLLDKEYFRFVRTVVEAKWNVGNSRKSRRTNQNTSSSQPSSISEGADGDMSGLSRRGEDTYFAARICTRLAFHFMFKVYLTSHAHLRSDSASWQDMLLQLMDNNGTVVRVLLECMLEEISLLRCYLHSCALKTVRDMIVWLISTVIHRANQLSTPAPSTPASPSQDPASITSTPVPANTTANISPSGCPNIAEPSSMKDRRDKSSMDTIKGGQTPQRNPDASGSGPFPAHNPLAAASPSVTPQSEGVSSGLVGVCGNLVSNLLEELVKMFRHALMTTTSSTMQVEVHGVVEILIEYCKLGPSAVATLARMDVIHVAVHLSRRLNDLQSNGEDYWAEELSIISRLVLHMVCHCSDLTDLWKAEQGALATPCPLLVGDLRCEDIFPAASLRCLRDEHLIRDMPAIISLQEEDCLHLACILTWNHGPRTVKFIHEVLEFLEACQEADLENIVEPVKCAMLIKDDLHTPRVKAFLMGISPDSDGGSMLTVLAQAAYLPNRLNSLLRLSVALVDSSQAVRKSLWEHRVRVPLQIKTAFDTIGATVNRMEAALNNPSGGKSMEHLQRLYTSIVDYATRLHQTLQLHH